jgi:nucleoside-diphosphate-sugar epimerase
MVMAWNGKKVLVTGARGFIGKYLVFALLRQGAEVKGLTIDAGQAGEGVRWVKGDITDRASIKGVCQDVDVVLHLAAISNVDASVRDPLRTINTNTMGTANLLEEARAGTAKKFVYVSSAHVYGVPKYVPVDEAHPTVPREAYAASKIASEQIVQAYANSYGLDFAILRPFNVFGAGQDASFLIPGVISQALKNGVIRVGNTDPTRDFLYVDDCVSGFLCVGDRGTGIFNIGSGEDRSIASVVEKIRDLVDPGMTIESDESRKRAGKVEIPRLCADISRLKALGWTPAVGFDEGLARTVAAERGAR